MQTNPATIFMAMAIAFSGVIWRFPIHGHQLAGWDSNVRLRSEQVCALPHCHFLFRFDRMLLFGMPKKYQPDFPFLRAIPTSRVIYLPISCVRRIITSLPQVHLFTGLQLLCFVTLWLIQTFKATSILFPIMLVLLIGIRKLLDFVFTPKELKV